MQKPATVALSVLTLTLVALAALAQQHDRLFELRRELIDRVETAYTGGDSATLERMAAVERRLDTLRALGPDVVRDLRAVGADTFKICPDRYNYAPTTNMCLPEASTRSTSEPVAPMVVSMASSNPNSYTAPGSHSIWLPGPSLGPPDISPPAINTDCTVDDPAAAAVASACSLQQVEICNSGTSAQCQAKIAECTALWANVSVTCAD